MEKHNTTPVTLSHETATQLKTLFADSEIHFEEPQEIENHLWQMLVDALAYDNHNLTDAPDRSGMALSCKTLFASWKIMQLLHKEMPYESN